MRRSVDNAGQLGLFVPSTLNLSTVYPRGQRAAARRQPALTRRQQVRGGRYMALAPARAGGEQQNGRVADAGMARPGPVILTPSTSTGSSDTLAQSPAPCSPCPMRSVDTTRLDDPFVGNTVRYSNLHAAQPSSENIPQLC